MRLRVASGQERADLIRRWNRASEREDLSKWFKENGYDRVDDGLEFVLVLDGNRFERSAAAQVWKKRGNRKGGVYLSLNGNNEEWYGITFNDDRAKTLLEVRRKGEISERDINAKSAALIADGSVGIESTPGCDACEVGCVLAATAWIVTSATVCYITCGVATFRTLGQASNCMAGCTAFVATEGATAAKCPDLCRFIGAC